MATRRATVFGGSGFIGRNLIRRLAAQGWLIAAAERDPVRAEFLRPMGGVGQIVPIGVNILDETAVARAVAGADVVVNLVGILYESDKYTFDAVHRAGAERIARLARVAGVRRVVHVSALGADVRSPALYARTKAAGEAAMRAAFPETTILRPSIVFGPEDQFFNRFAGMARLSPVLPLIGGGRTRFQPVYVGDVAAAIFKCLDDPATAARVYELGGPRVYTFRELMELTLAQIGRRRCLVSLPFGLARFEARFLELLPKPLLTRDQVELLKRDNIVGPGAATLADLGIRATAVEVILPTYLDRFMVPGRLARLPD